MTVDLKVMVKNTFKKIYLHFFILVVHIWNTGCFRCVDNNKGCGLLVHV